MSDNEVKIYDRKPCNMLLEALSTKSVAASRQNWLSQWKLTNLTQSIVVNWTHEILSITRK